jgi:hypothetical protein
MMTSLTKALLDLQRSQMVRRGMAALSTVARHESEPEVRRAARVARRSVQRVLDAAAALEARLYHLELYRMERYGAGPVFEEHPLLPGGRLGRACFLDSAPEWRTVAEFLFRHGRNVRGAVEEVQALCERLLEASFALAAVWRAKHYPAPAAEVQA